MNRQSVFGRETCASQHPQGVLDKRISHMAQYTLLQVLTAMERVDDLTFVIHRHGVHGEITPRQIFLQRYVRRGIHRKTMVAMTIFAFGSRQRVFVVGIGMQKDGEIRPYLAKARSQHGFGC